MKAEATAAWKDVKTKHDLALKEDEEKQKDTKAVKDPANTPKTEPDDTPSSASSVVIIILVIMIIAALGYVIHRMNKRE